MVNTKDDPRTVTSDQTSTARESQNTTHKGDIPKNTTATPEGKKARSARPLRLFCCLPKGEAYTDQPANKKAAELEARARSWIEANPSAWSRMVEEIRADVEAKRRWAMRRLIEEARTYDLVDANGEPFRVNNVLESALARIVCEEMPEAREYVSLRMSVFEVAHAERNEKVA